MPRGSSVTAAPRKLFDEEQALLDFFAWGQFYTMDEVSFRDPKQPWNRKSLDD